MLPPSSNVRVTVSEEMVSHYLAHGYTRVEGGTRSKRKPKHAPRAAEDS